MTTTADAEALADLNGENTADAAAALLAIVHGSQDYCVIETAILAKLKDLDLRGLAVTCIGHVARLHGRLSPPLYAALDEARNDSDVTIRSRASDADDDVRIYLSGGTD